MSTRYNATPQGKRAVVASFGQWSLFEYTVAFERDSAGPNLVNVTEQNLLPVLSESDFVDIQTAQAKSGLTYKKLVELCEDGKVNAKRSNGKWMISLSSLADFMAS